MPSLNTPVKPNCILCLLKCVLSLFIYFLNCITLLDIHISCFGLSVQNEIVFARIIHQSNIGVLKLYNSGAAQ